MNTPSRYDRVVSLINADTARWEAIAAEYNCDFWYGEDEGAFHFSSSNGAIISATPFFDGSNGIRYEVLNGNSGEVDHFAEQHVLADAADKAVVGQWAMLACSLMSKHA